MDDNPQEADSPHRFGGEHGSKQEGQEMMEYRQNEVGRHAYSPQCWNRRRNRPRKSGFGNRR